MSETKTVYKLYALAATYENVLAATAEKYYRITADYILVYTSGSAPANSVEFQDEDASRLTESERQWLYGINLELLQEQIAKETPQIVERLGRILAELEKGVNAEHGGADSNDAGTP